LFAFICWLYWLGCFSRLYLYGFNSATTPVIELISKAK
jgi:hypothetical protein